MQMPPLTWEACETLFEWDGSLRDVDVFCTDLDAWPGLLSFLRDLARHLGKPVIVTPENLEQHPLFEITPGD